LEQSLKNLILFGFKSCGKTHFGNLLSKQLHIPFIDTDTLIEKRYASPLSVREIYSQVGQETFRALETEAIQAIPQNPSRIISLGGGAVLNLNNISYLKGLGKLIYLKINFQTAQNRILQTPLPAFIDPKYPLFSLHKVYQERLSLYEAIADISIDTNSATETDILNTLIKSYGSL